jgi:epoxyqueuosine reductase QueG
MSGNPSSGSRIATPTALGLDPRLEAAGFNTAGVLSASEYDALVPALWRSAALLANAQSVVVLGCGGRAFSEAFMHSSKARATTERDPIDRFTARVVHAAIAEMAQRGASAHALFYWDQRQGEFADFVALGCACGLGSESRLGILLHPVFGPWISLRAVILTQNSLPPTPPLPRPGPCVGCFAPCATACPAQAPAHERFDIDACENTTLARAACRQHCDARRACVIGSTHAYPPEMEQMFRSAAVNGDVVERSL